MAYSTENFYKTFENVRKRIANKLCIKEINTTRITLRSDIRNFVEAAEFVAAYEDVTRCRFKVCVNKSPWCRSNTGKKWVCSHRSLNRESINLPPLKCPAMVHISLKKITKYSKLKDAFLRRNPPFRAVIRIDPNHNHLMGTEVVGKYLKISGPVKDCFYEYFKRGISGVKAKMFHEENLRKANFHALEDASMNPSLAAIFALHKNWKKLKENIHLSKVCTSKVPDSVQIVNVQPNNITQITSDKNCINNNMAFKYEVGQNENANFDRIPDQVLQSFRHDEDMKPLLNIKKEIVDDNDGLPVIESYGSLASPSATNSPNVVRMNMGSANTQLVVYDKSSNTFKVVKYLSVGQRYNFSDHSSSQYSYIPRTLLPPRIALHRI